MKKGGIMVCFNHLFLIKCITGIVFILFLSMCWMQREWILARGHACLLWLFVIFLRIKKFFTRNFFGCKGSQQRHANFNDDQPSFFDHLANRFLPNNATNIIVFMLDESPSVQKIIAGLKKTLGDTLKVSAILHVCNGGGNVAKLRNGIELTLSEDTQYDMAVTIGRTATLLAKNATMLLDEKPPIVFTAVKNPVGFKLVGSYNSSGNHLTGVTGINHDYKKQIELLLFLKSDVKKVLILHDTLFSKDDEAQKTIETLLCAKGITVQNLAVKDKRELGYVVEDRLKQDSEIDTLITLRDSLIASMPIIASVCNKYNVPILASDSSSVEAGAALGFGAPDELYGVFAAKHILEILKEHKFPSDIPISLLDTKETFRCNMAVLRQQGFDIPNKLFEFMNYVEAKKLFHSNSRTVLQ
jgi:ABC-type uncharacterized transport system substrate-binding protein